MRIALVTAGAFGTNRRAARGRKCLHGLSGVTLENTVPKPARAGRATAASEGAIRLVRVSRSRMVGSRGCSLTTSRVQRLVRGTLSATGSSASASEHGSDQRESDVPSP